MALTAYSGGTVWDLHPLRVAAGASVKLCPDYSADARRGCFTELIFRNMSCSQPNIQ